MFCLSQLFNIVLVIGLLSIKGEKKDVSAYLSSLPTDIIIIQHGLQRLEVEFLGEWTHTRPVLLLPGEEPRYRLRSRPTHAVRPAPVRSCPDMFVVLCSVLLWLHWCCCIIMDGAKLTSNKEKNRYTSYRRGAVPWSYVQCDL